MSDVSTLAQPDDRGDAAPHDIYDAEQIAAHITRFQRSLDYIQPALAEALTQRYAEALLSWFHKPT